MSGNGNDDDWIEDMNAQNRAALERNVPKNADDLRPVDPVKAEISMRKKSTERMKEFNVLMRKLNNELCQTNSVYIEPLQKNPNLVEDSTWKNRFDDKRSNILNLITKIEGNYNDYIKNTVFERGLVQLRYKVNQFNHPMNKNQIRVFDLVCDNTSTEVNAQCSCAIMGGRRTRRRKSRKNKRKSIKKYIRKNKRRTQKSRRMRRTKRSRKTRK